MSQPFLQSVDNALQILELFDHKTRELGLTEISRRLGVGKSTAHRLLSTLAKREFVEQNPDNGRYRLGIKAVYIGYNKLNTLSIIDDCHPILLRLSENTNESAHLSFYSNGYVTFVDKVVGRNPAVMSSLIGYKLPAHMSASGKVFLAHLAERELEEFFRVAKFVAHTPFSITEPAALRAVISKIKKHGYAEDQQEADEGLVCFAAPVLDHYDNIVAAISVSGAASRMNTQREELVRAVKKAAWQASVQCGCRLPEPV